MVLSWQHVSLRQFRPAARRRARRAVSRPDAALLGRPADRGRLSTAAAPERPVHPEVRTDAADRDPLWALVDSPIAHPRPDRTQVRPRLRPLHHAPESPIQLAEARGRTRYSRRAGRG